MYNKYFITVSLFILAVHSSTGFFSNALKKLKEKSKQAYKKQFGRDKTWHFLGHDLTEYPGTNEKYRQINKEKWNDYYACLSTQDTNLGHDFSITPEAIQAIESSSVRLECKLCLSPQETTRLDTVQWYWAGHHNKTMELVEYQENILLSPTDKALQIYNLHEQHTGQYICRIGLTEAPPYFLTVVDSHDEDLSGVHSPEAPTGPYPQKPEQINGNLVIDTKWTTWSACSKCNQIGRRHRFGYCIVRYEERHPRQVNDINKTTENTNNQTIDIPKDDYDLLQIFKFGIPCSSHVLPHSVKSLTQVLNRKNEIMSGFCKADCPEDKIFEVRDKDGNVIERANNSAGIYSMLQGIPSLQPSVERQLQFAEKGKEVILSCPGNLNSDVPVQWQMGSKKLVPELIAAESKGRIYISITDKIHIKDAKISDTNIYR